MTLVEFVDWLVKIATIGSALFIAAQAWIFKRDYNLKNERAEVETAVNLAKFYNDKILSTNMSYLFNIFKLTGIEELLRDLNYHQLVEFDNEEMIDVLGKEKIELIRSKFDQIELLHLFTASICINEETYDEFKIHDILVGLEKELKNPKATKQANNKSQQKVPSSNIQIAEIAAAVDMSDQELINMYYFTRNVKMNELGMVISTTLNQLEYFCMSFNTKIADEEVVYQSLHQSFLSTIKCLYFSIASLNNNGTDKYYTNIIQLFNQWSRRYFEMKEQERNMKRESVHTKKALKK